MVTQLILWKAAGEEIILCGDFNENVYTGRFARRLAATDINMKEQCLKCTGDQLPATFVSGNRPIDGVFATAGVEVLHAALLPKYGGIGDHRCFILDFVSKSVMGNIFPRVLPPSARKLHCDSERIRDNYNAVLNKLMDRHQMFKKMNELTRLADYMSVEVFQVKLNRWDDEMTDYMRAAEKQCRQYFANPLEWSPEVGIWIRRRRILQQIEKYLLGRVPDARNLFRTCEARNIASPDEFSLALVRTELFICHKKLQELRLKAPEMRVAFLCTRIQEAKDRNDDKAVKDI